MITNRSIRSLRNAFIVALSWSVYQCGRLSVEANPGVGTVSQGSALFSTSGSQETITTAANTFINWNSFNINAGETTTFVQPSSSSVVWNNITGGSASQILGNLNANGYVILQNPSGFYVGGQAAISVHGLILTTAPTPAPELSSGGAWEFNAPPPAAKIINYGQINISGGGSAYLIAGDIENNGTISAPSGNIGLYAGEQVYVSTAPNGLGLSARVTLPAGSVDNEGKLIADGGTIAAEAQTINQNGLVQANSMQNVNGTIELVGSEAVNLGASSVISAQGDSSGNSSGGSVTIQSANTFSDQDGSTINIAGGAQGGNGGEVEISAPAMGSIQSSINGQASSGFLGGTLTIDPTDIWLASANTDPEALQGYSVINVDSFSGLSQINLQADDNIVLNTVWTLPVNASSSSLNLSAGNNITLNDGSGINAGNNWSVNLSAGPHNLASGPASGSDGVYLDGNASIQTQNGNINVWAANEVQVGYGGYSDQSGYSGIRTLDGGNIDVTAQYGDVNAGANSIGFDYQVTAPYFTASAVLGAYLGGISTASGGNVTITAGGDVISYLPGPTDTGDAGSGAFGAAPGNVTIIAGDNVYGHYVLVNGAGLITAGDNVGEANVNSFALSLVSGTWDVNAPNGSIYLQEVRNPNGDFNDIATFGIHHTPNPGLHLFDYAPDATVDLTAGDGVTLTGLNVPRTADYSSIQVIYPPILNITAGPGGINLENDVTLFPSVDQNLDLTTTAGGNLVAPAEGASPAISLLMSDSSQTQWIYNTSGSDISTIVPFSVQDNSAGVPVQSGNPNPVTIDISGSIENLDLITSKATEITVGGNMINSGFSGQNLNAGDVTSITVAGQIYNEGSFSYVNNVTIPNVPVADLLPGLANSWDDVFYLAVNPKALANLTLPANLPSSDWAQYILESSSLTGSAVSVFGVTFLNGAVSGLATLGLIGNEKGGTGFNYNPATGQLGYVNEMSSSILSVLEQPITILKLVNGVPVPITVVNPDGTISTTWETTTVYWAPPSAVQTLYASNLRVPDLNDPAMGYQLGGPGQFDIDAGSISLGSCAGILSCGVNDQGSDLDRYGNLASITPEGATLNVTVTGNLDMLSSTIATLGGGDVNVTSTGGSIELGSENLVDEQRQIGFGIFSAGQGNVNVSTFGDIDIGGSRIAAYDGGNIFVESLQGDINVGSGGDTYNSVDLSYIDPNGNANYYTENVYGSGILATTLVTPESDATYSTPSTDWPVDHATVPGNITVETPQGNITATLGGITQEALDGNIDGGPTVTLIAGTPASGIAGQPGYFAGYPGNIDLGQSGVIGGTVNATANGNISGLIISRQNSDINAAQNFSGSVLAGGSADVGAGGSVSGVIVGVGGASVSGGSVTASILGQDVSINGGAAESTLGSSATATSTSQSASQQANSASQQLANNDDESDDDDKKKHKKAEPLMQRIKRVTVILPKT